MAGQRSCQPLYKINSKILITMFIFLVNPCFPCITPIHLLIHYSFQFSNTPYSPYYCPSLQSMFTVESSLCTIVPAKCLLRSKNYIRDSVIFCSITYYYFFSIHISENDIFKHKMSFYADTSIFSFPFRYSPFIQKQEEPFCSSCFCIVTFTCMFCLCPFFLR